MTRDTDISDLDSKFDFELGIVQGAKGLRGDLKLKAGTDFALYHKVKKAAALTTSGATIPLTVRSLREEGRHILISFKEYPDRSAAEQLSGSKILVRKSDLEDLGDDEWWIEDLVGLSAFKVDGTKIGVISAVYNAAGQLLEIKAVQPDGAEKEFLVPFVKALVPVVDIKAGRVEIVDMPGLLE